jgi:hypothetical protein
VPPVADKHTLVLRCKDMDMTAGVLCACAVYPPPAFGAPRCSPSRPTGRLMSLSQVSSPCRTASNVQQQQQVGVAAVRVQGRVAAWQEHQAHHMQSALGLAVAARGAGAW